MYGTICRSIRQPTEELVHGNALLAEQRPETVDEGDSYTLEAIHQALEDYPPPPGVDGSSAWETFVGYLVLDALIGNTDRHAANWAVIVSEPGRYLAPTFDHASSLGFLLSDPERLKRIVSRDLDYTPEAFADRAKTKFSAKPHPIRCRGESPDTGRRRRCRTLAQPTSRDRSPGGADPGDPGASDVEARSEVRRTGHPSQLGATDAVLTNSR